MSDFKGWIGFFYPIFRSLRRTAFAGGGAMNRIPVGVIDQARAVDLAALVSERVTLKQRGREYSGLCPFHEERTPSFTVRPDKGFWHCFGCGAHGGAIDWVMHWEGLSFPQAVERLSGWRPDPNRPVRKEQARPVRDRDRENRMIALAREFVRAARPLRSGDPVWLYLQDRGLDPERSGASVALRHLPVMKIYDGGRDTGRRAPAMIGPVRNGQSGRIVAVHVTFLALEAGRWVKAGPARAPSPRIILGPKAGGAVRLGPPLSRIDYAEGLETALSIVQAHGGPDRISLWACLTAENLVKQPVQPGQRESRFWMDLDRPQDRLGGIGAGEYHACRAAEAHAAEGLAASLCRPPRRGDFNDVLQGSAA